MAQFAPVYMTTYDEDGTNHTLVAITVSADEVEEGSPANTVVGDLSGYFDERSVLTTDNDNFAVVWNATKFQLVVGPSGATLEPGDYPVTIREVSQYTNGSPRVSTVTITVTPEA